MNPELPDADDRRIWGDREPFDPVEMWAAMDTPECIELSLEMLQMVTAAVEFKAEDRPRD